MNKNGNINSGDLLWHLERVSMSGVNGKRIDNISIDIESGVTAVIGPSGSGKTSMLNLLVEYEKQDSGQITVADKAKPFFWVPQNLGLWPHMRVGEHLDAMTSRSDKEATAMMLERFEMMDKQNVYPSQLSQGEKSRLAMARALISSPSVLVMDEPLINIDPAKQLFFWDIVIEIAEKKGISLVYATHSPKHVVGTAANVICMNNAAIIYSGSVEELYHSPSSFELAEYLGDINWIEKDDSFLVPEKVETLFPLKLRPEQVTLKKNPNGHLKVLKSIFRGEITMSVIEDKVSGKRYELYHRPSTKPQNGEIVELILK